MKYAITKAGVHVLCAIICDLVDCAHKKEEKHVRLCEKYDKNALHYLLSYAIMRP